MICLRDSGSELGADVELGGDLALLAVTQDVVGYHSIGAWSFAWDGADPVCSWCQHVEALIIAPHRRRYEGIAGFHVADTGQPKLILPRKFYK